MIRVLIAGVVVAAPTFVAVLSEKLGLRAGSHLPTLPA